MTGLLYTPQPNPILQKEVYTTPSQAQKGLVKGKSLRRRMSRWQHGLIRECVLNKAQEYGLLVCEIDPRYTSQDCSRCGLRGKRKRHKFNCPHCDFELHADINAARNIRTRYVVSRHDGLASISPEALSSVLVTGDEGKLSPLGDSN